MLVVVVHSFLFFILLSSLFFLLLFFIHFCHSVCFCCSFHCFSTSCLTLPWTIAGFLHPFYSFSPAHCRVICKTFILPFPRSSFSQFYCERFSVGIFYPQAFFTLRSFTDILTCVYQGLPGSWRVFHKFSRASYWSSNHRPGPSVCLIHSNPQSSYSERFSFKFYHILSWIACGESLIYLLLTRFELFSLVQSICKDY